MQESTYQHADHQIKRLNHAIQSRRRIAITFYILYPFAALWYAIKNYRDHWAKNIVWLFVIFYGLTFVISNNEIDANRYRDIFLNMARTEVSFTNFFTLLYSEETNYVDIAQPLISFTLSLFTDNYRILFATFGAIFGYFYSRNIWYLLELSGQSVRRSNIPIIITFAFIVGFWEINGFRFWTATHVFFYGAIRYVMEDKKKGLLIAASTIFIHFSFMAPIVILVLYSILGNRIHLYFWLFLATFFISEIDLGFVRAALLNYLPSAFETKVESYTSEYYAESIRGSATGLSWHAVYYRLALEWANNLFIIGIYYKGLPFLKQNRLLLSLFCFSLLFLAVGNILSLVPSGARFVIVGYLFMIALIFLYLQHAQLSRLIANIKFITLPALALFCMVSLRIGFDTIGVMTVIGNPLFALFGNVDIALIELIK